MCAVEQDGKVIFFQGLWGYPSNTFFYFDDKLTSVAGTHKHPKRYHFRATRFEHQRKRCTCSVTITRLQ